MLRRAHHVALAALLFTFLAIGTASAQYGPTPSDEPEGTIDIEPAEVTAGGDVENAAVTAGGDLVITGEGFASGTEVLGVLIGPNGDPVVDVQATTTVLADGTFRLVIPVPSDAPCGDYTVTATGTAADGSPRTISKDVTVGGCSAADAGGIIDGIRGGILAATGLQVAGVLALAAGLLGFGAFAVRVSRRRQAG